MESRHTVRQRDSTPGGRAGVKQAFQTGRSELPLSRSPAATASSRSLSAKIPYRYGNPRFAYTPARKTVPLRSLNSYSCQVFGYAEGGEACSLVARAQPMMCAAMGSVRDMPNRTVKTLPHAL